jgi:hypothetical protein
MIVNPVCFCDGIDGVVAEEFTQSLQVFDPGVVGEQAVVADTMEAVRQHVNEKAADELGRGQSHGLVTITPPGTIVLPLEGDTALIASEQAAVADGDPMGVTSEVSKHGLRSGERALGIDCPVDGA